MLLIAKEKNEYVSFGRSYTEKAVAETYIMLTALRSAADALFEMSSVDTLGGLPERAALDNLVSLKELYSETRKDLDEIGIVLMVVQNRLSVFGGE